MPNSESSTNSQQILKDILQQHKSEDFILPPLNNDSNFLADLLRQIGSLIRKLFSGNSTPEVKGLAAIVGMLFQYFITIAIVAGLIWVIWTLIKYYRNSRPESFLGENAVKVSAEFLDEELKQALQQKLWAKAMRIRWRIFLTRKNISVSMTPMEFFKILEPKSIPKLEVSTQYALMFYQADEPERIYKLFEQELTEREKSEREEKHSDR